MVHFEDPDNYNASFGEGSPIQRPSTDSNSKKPIDLPHLLNLPSPGTFKQHASYHARRDGNPTQDRNTHEAFFRNLIIYQSPQAARLKIPRLMVDQEIVVPPCFRVVAELVVSQSQIEETFAPALGGCAEDLGEQTDPFLLFAAGG